MDIPRRGRLLLVLLCGGLVSGSIGRLPAQEPPPIFTGERLLDPPRQGEPWTPPETELPKAFVVATKTLFDLGLADPRGCEYRQVEVVTHSLLGGRSATPTRGWVLPAAKPGGDRFVVCWNGLVYPSASIGAPADLRADVRKAITADEVARKAVQKDPNSFFFSTSRRFDPTRAEPEGEAVSAEAILPLKACLLLRLGEEELARELWTGWAAGLDKVNNNQEYGDKPYIVLAENWTWYLFDRAVGAHASGDDRVALLTARALAAIGPRAAEMAAKLGVQSYTNTSERSRRHKDGSFEIATFQDDKQHPFYLNESPTLRPLLADQERRAHEKTGQKPPPRGEGRAARVAALIRELEEVSVPQMSQPGYPNLGESPAVKGLIAEGTAAVEPLLDVLERDPRLTRTVSYWRDYSPSRNIIPVYEAAYYVLARTLETSDFDVADPDPKLDGRAHRGRGAGLLGEVQGASAGGALVSHPARGQGDAGPVAPGGRAHRRAGAGRRRRMRGESLRGKVGPTVVEVMARRVRDLAGRPATPDEPDRHLETRLALDLSKWDPAAAVPALRDLTARLRARLAEAKDVEAARSWPGEGARVSIAELALARVRGGDARALGDYAAWVKSIPAKDLLPSVPGVFEPIWSHPRHPAIAEAAERLFGDPGSPWGRELRAGQGAVASLVSSPMAGVPAFRKALLALLADKARMGKVTVKMARGAGEPMGNMTLEFDSGSSTMTGFDASDPLAPKEGGASPLRVCDYHAWLLTAISGFPAFGPYWPEAKRDEAVAACSAFLVRYGARIQPADESSSTPRWAGNVEARLVFPRLDHPATPAEVRNGLAIFSLTGEGPARVAHLARRPIRARWVGRKGRPRAERDQEGWIWQAEELHKDSVWSRIYGFVGLHVVARVPAEEVEAISDEGPPGGL